MRGVILAAMLVTATAAQGGPGMGGGNPGRYAVGNTRDAYLFTGDLPLEITTAPDKVSYAFSFPYTVEIYPDADAGIGCQTDLPGKVVCKRELAGRIIGQIKLANGRLYKIVFISRGLSDTDLLARFSQVVGSFEQ